MSHSALICYSYMHAEGAGQGRSGPRRCALGNATMLSLQMTGKKDFTGSVSRLLHGYMCIHLKVKSVL